MKKYISLLLGIQIVINLAVSYLLLYRNFVVIDLYIKLDKIIYSLLTGFLIIITSYFIHKILSIWIKGKNTDKISLSTKLKNNTSIICWILFIVTSSCIEELLMRYCLLNFLITNTTHIILSIILSSLIFGLYHFRFKELPQLFIMGIILSVLYLKTHNIIYPIIAHSLNNIVIYCIFLYNKHKQL